MGKGSNGESVACTSKPDRILRLPLKDIVQRKLNW